MSVAICRLCRQLPAIKNSHVISKLVYRAIKSDSPTGFFRNPNYPNKREQDGGKVGLLCEQCECRFNAAETQFANQVFLPFHNSDVDHFIYGPWLHYFLASIAWRTLVLDLPDLESNNEIPRRAIAELANTAETMRNYLLGTTHLGTILRIHAFLQTAAHSASLQLARIGPNVTIRRSVFGYTLVENSHGYAGVLHNLAGFLCFLIIKGNPCDVWNNTKVSPVGGELKQPQKVTSWLAADLMKTLIDMSETGASLMSPTQRQRIADSLKGKTSAASLRFQRLDSQIVVD